MFRQTNVALRDWKYDWEKDFYLWLTDRPDPRRRRSWRFHGKAILPWFRKAYLSPEGTGCKGLYNMVLQCLEGSGHPFLPASDCTKELNDYRRCVKASAKFAAHWQKEVVPEYKAYLDTFDNSHTARSSWKQTRNLMKLWYGSNSRDRSLHRVSSQSNTAYPFFPDATYTPEGWDKRIADEGLRHLLKDSQYPHVRFARGVDPNVWLSFQKKKMKLQK